MKLLPYIVIVLLFLVHLNAYSRSNVVSTGSKPAGMGNAFVSQYDVFSVFHNQAGLAKIDRTSISMFYENRFMVKQLSTRAGIIAFATESGNFALQFNAFGPAQWGETNIGIAYSRFITEKISAGLQLNYFGVKLPEENATAISASFELGAIYQLSEKSFLGIHVANPYSPAINTLAYNEKIPWRINFGGHTQFTSDFQLSYEIEKIEIYPLNVKTGVQWQAVNDFYIRGGVNTSPVRFYTGFGYQSRFFIFDAAIGYHQYLGAIPSVSLIFSFF